MTDQVNNIPDGDLTLVSAAENLLSFFAGYEAEYNEAVPEFINLEDAIEREQEKQSRIIDILEKLLDEDDGPVIDEGFNNPWVSEAQTLLVKLKSETGSD